MEMRYNNYLNFSLYQIKEFLSLYENLNYTKAAKECYVTQSTLSRNIQSMENSLGIQLFVRNTVKVTPTPAGVSLYSNLKNIYQNYEEAIMRAYQVQAGKSHPLTIGISDGLDIMPELLPFIRTFYKTHPNFEINVIRDYDYTLTSKLEDHTCDIVFDLSTENSKNPYIKMIPLFSSSMMLYMLKSNPLCAKETLALKDLVSQHLLVRSPSKGSDHVTFLRKLYDSLGVEPNLSFYVNNAMELALNIQNDDQAILADAYYIDRNCPYLDARIVENTESIIWMKWLGWMDKDTDTQVFVREIQDYFE